MNIIYGVVALFIVVGASCVGISRSNNLEQITKSNNLEQCRKTAMEQKYSPEHIREICGGQPVQEPTSK